MNSEPTLELPKARLYQEELLDKAKEKNSLICLGTGAGKTFIAAMLISHYSHELEPPYDETGKRTFFLVPTRPLVKQQAGEIVKKTRFSENDVGEYTGDMNVDFWSKEVWLEHLRAKKIFVMTRQIFLNMLNAAVMPLSKVNLLIFDEAHHAAPKAKKKKNKEPKDCYKLIMNCIQSRPRSDQPRILGLSASLINANSSTDALQQTITDLEHTYGSTCISVTDLDEVRKYATDPVEIVWEYDYDEVAFESGYQAKEFLGAIHKIFIELDRQNKSNQVEPMEGNNDQVNTQASTCIVVDLPIGVQEFVKCRNTISHILWSMGPWCAVEACDFYIREFQEFIDLYEHFYPAFGSILRCVNEMVETVAGLIKYDFYLRQLSMEEMIVNLTSNKMKRLLQLLMEYNDPNENLAGIIFVKERAICKSMCKWMQKVKEIDEKFGFVNVDYIVGEAGRPGFANKIAVKAAQLQRETLNKFRKCDINLLFATSILEEGLDVSQCNLVVRYDGVDSYRQWVQSQGRARSKDGRFVVFSEREALTETKKSLSDFKHLSNKLQTIATSGMRTHLPTPSVTLISPPEDEMPLVNPINGARVTLDSAKQIVYMYCSRLPSDAFFVINALETEKETTNGCQVVIRMPINSPLRELIEGPVKRNKSLATKAAYLKVCRILREQDEIDESFVPYTKKARLQKIIEQFHLTCQMDEDDAGDLVDGPKPGTRKRRQIYSKSFEKMFCNLPIKSSAPSCLYSINVEPSTGDQSIGFICAEHVQLSNIVSSFPVFIKTAEFKISIKSIVDTNVHLSSHQLYQLQLFHQVVFHESLGFKRNRLTFDDASPVYVVPLSNKRDGIDWTMIEQTLQRHDVNNMNRLTENPKRFKFDESEYNDAMVYRRYDPVGLFEVLKVDEKTPNSPFPNNDNGYTTYADYYIKKYGLQIVHPTYPLLRVDSIGFNSSIKRVDLTQSERKRKPIDLVPELLFIFPIPTSFHRQCRLLPAIFYRLCQMYNVEQLRERIASEANFGWKPLPPDHSWGKMKIDFDKTNPNLRERNDDDSSDSCSDSEDSNEQPGIEMECESSVVPESHEEIESKCSSSSHIYGDVNELKRKYSNFNVQTYVNGMKGKLFQHYKELLHTPLVNYDPGNHSQYLPKNSSGIREQSEVDLNRVQSFDCHSVDDDDDINGPTPSLLLQALTTRNAIDMFNMERLETLGDSFLKLTTSAYFYYKLPMLNEGYLSLLKVNQISNYNLYRLGSKKNLGEFMVAQQFQPSNSWLPPGFFVNTENVVAEKNDGKMFDKYTKQKAADKSIADVCEALIGAYLLSSGPKGAVNFMTWLGIRIMDPTMQNDAMDHWLPTPRSAQVTSIDSEIKIRNLAATLTGFEEYIGYKFRDKCFLIQAMTHVSYHDNTVTDCYQRLEFLGDAVLDYLITRYIYEDSKHFAPGDLTDLRAALTNNAFFGSVAVKHRFHVLLKMNSYELYRSIHSFAEKFKVNSNDVVRGNFMTLLDEREAQSLDDIDVPKALGDVFESVAGAVYLDSNYSLDAVWRVYYPLMKLELEEFSKNIPKSPLSLLYIKYPNSVVFSKATIVNKNQVSVNVTVTYKSESFTEIGCGKNRYWAKSSAAKRSLNRKILAN